MDTAQTVLKSARSFFAGTLLSRLSGMLRDIAMAISFGSSPEIAAFMVAYRLAYLFRRLVGEGNLQAGFVPHFEAARANGQEKAFYRDVSASFALGLVGLVLILEAFLYGARSFLVGSSWFEIADLAMWMVPGLLFVSLYALNSAVLQCEKRYFTPAVAPVAFNLIWVAAAFFAPSVRVLAGCVTLALAAQWILTQDWQISWRQSRIFGENFRLLLKPMGLGILGVGAVQINSALDALFARSADISGPTFLWYAIRLEQLPLALFGIALSGALLPPLTRAIQQGERLRYLQLLRGGLFSSTALMLPCVFGIFSLGLSGLNLLYGHGHFEEAAVFETFRCLAAYAFGLLPSVWVLLLAAGFYAQKTYQIPTRASLYSVCANIGLNTFFVFGLDWGALSIALATSAATFLNVFYLSKALKQQFGVIFEKDFAAFFLKMTLASALPALITASVEHIWMGGVLSRRTSVQLVHFAALSAIYFGGLFACARALNIKEFFDLLRLRKAPLNEFKA